MSEEEEISSEMSWICQGLQRVMEVSQFKKKKKSWEWSCQKFKCVFCPIS